MATHISCSAIVESSAGVLLVREGGLEPAVFNLPGGGKKGRESILDCVVRETKEETGLIVEPEHLIGIYQRPKTGEGSKDLIRIVVSALAIGGTITASDKHPVVDFYPHNEVLAFKAGGLMKGHGTMRAIKDYRRGQRAPLGILGHLGSAHNLRV